MTGASRLARIPNSAETPRALPTGDESDAGNAALDALLLRSMPKVFSESRPYFLAREIARGEFVSLRVREQARARRENAVRIGI